MQSGQAVCVCVALLTGKALSKCSGRALEREGAYEGTRWGVLVGFPPLVI